MDAWMQEGKDALADGQVSTGNDKKIFFTFIFDLNCFAALILESVL